jgi:hypothetical protein
VRASCRIGGSGKAAQILEEGNGSLERERERGQDERGEKPGEQVSAGSTPDPNHGTKMLGKTLLPKKAHEKSLMSKSKV